MKLFEEITDKVKQKGLDGVIKTYLAIVLSGQNISEEDFEEFFSRMVIFIEEDTNDNGPDLVVFSQGLANNGERIPLVHFQQQGLAPLNNEQSQFLEAYISSPKASP